jgi:murein L,D-transpeptidase YcbB/YkuD
VIRQRPGEKNALGRVSFISLIVSILLHDTPVKSLFQKDKRAYSHGVISTKEPEKHSNYVLPQDQPEWTPEKIEEAMNSGEREICLK